MKIKYRLFQSESCDWYKIPEKNYEKETKEYNELMGHGGYDEALKFEEGRTGWIGVDPHGLYVY